MPKNEIPLFDIRHNCDETDIHNFKIASFNELTCTATEFEENHKHEYFEIIWLKDGSGEHQIDLQSHPYHGSAMFILAPGQIHKIDQKKPSEGYVIKFLPSIFRRENDFYDYILDTCLFDHKSSCPVMNIPKNIQPIIEDLCLQLRKEFQEIAIDSENIISSYLKILITHINRIKRNKPDSQQIINNPQYALFREFKIAVEKKYKEEHSVQFFAELLNTQTRPLNTVVRKFVELSAGEIIQERIVLEAQRSLYHETKSIKEICFELGFEDPAYFTRFFKKHTGLSPQAFKENKVLSL